MNVGYRPKIDERLSLTFTGRNRLDTMRQETVIETPLLRDRIRQKGAGPVLHSGQTWNLGSQAGRKRTEPAVDFDLSASAPPGQVEPRGLGAAPAEAARVRCFVPLDLAI